MAQSIESASPQGLAGLLETLLATWENEVIEAKSGGTGFPTDDIGKYFSALSNEAALRGASTAWLIFGIEDRTRSVCGTEYRREPGRLQALKQQISQDTSTGTTFREIHEVHHPDGRVLLFEIPAAPAGHVVSWKGHHYGRSGESLTALSLDKLDALRRQAPLGDWSAQAVPGATIDDLDPDALAAAREGFAAHHPRISHEEVLEWPARTFLDRAGLLADGALTVSALLLLGTPNGARRIPGTVLPEISWVLETEDRAYEHFAPPFLLATTRAYERIRNFQVRMTRPGTLMQTEVARYDRDAVLEALHNCVAHADWSSGRRINLREFADRIELSNPGGFIEGRSVEDYVLRDARPETYRNPALSAAMVKLNMIDRVGYGLKSIHLAQTRRYLPLPDYDLSDPDRVITTIYGRIIDPHYSEQLMARTDLELADVLALDRVQKGLTIDDPTTRHLRRKKLIEGRRPRLHVSGDVAAATSTVADYVRTRAQSDEHYAKLITDFIRTAGSASRKDLDGLLIPLLSDALTDDQKRHKVHNLLAKLRRDGAIRNVGTRRDSRWQLI